MSTEPKLRLEHVTKQFDIRGTDEVFKPRSRDINIDVAPGEFLVLVGPSGCGKSTLLDLPRRTQFAHFRSNPSGRQADHGPRLGSGNRLPAIRATSMANCTSQHRVRTRSEGREEERATRARRALPRTGRSARVSRIAIRTSCPVE